MAAFSIRRAVGSGFLLIRERPVSVFVWGVVTVLAGLGPVIAIMLPLWAQIATVAAQSPQASVEAMEGMHSSIQQDSALINALQLPSLLVQAVIMAAVFRAVLEPRKSAFAYLRIGASEGWLFLLILCVGIGAVFAILALILIVVGAFAAAARLQTPWNLAPCILAAAAIALVIWVALRLSMAAALTFAERRFRLFESWAVTKGQALRLLGLTLVVLLVMFGFELLVLVPVAVGVFLWFNGHPIDNRSLQDGLSQLASGRGLGDLAPWLAAATLVGAAFYGALIAIVTAPLASAFRDLRASSAGASA